MTEKKGGSFRTTTEIGSDLYFLAKENKIQFKQAMIVGLSMLLAEKGIDPYENQLTLSRLYEETKLKVSKYAQELYDLKQKIGDKTEDKIKEGLKHGN